MPLKRNGTSLPTNVQHGGQVVLLQSDPDKEYVVSTYTKKPRIRKPPFMAIAGGAQMIDKEKSLLQMIGKMTPAERWFFLFIEARVNTRTNIAIVRSAILTKTQIKYKVAAYKSVYQKGLIKRVRNEHYMINPNMIIPFNDDIYSAMVSTWKAIP